MRFVLDEGVPRTAAEHLRRCGHEAEHVLDLDLGGGSDERVIAAALSRNATVVTLDSDFHRLLSSSGAIAPSVLRIRVEGLDGPALALLVNSVIDRAAEDVLAGAAASVTQRSVRVRRLPLK